MVEEWAASGGIPFVDHGCQGPLRRFWRIFAFHEGGCLAGAAHNALFLAGVSPAAGIGCLPA